MCVFRASRPVPLPDPGDGIRIQGVQGLSGYPRPRRDETGHALTPLTGGRLPEGFSQSGHGFLPAPPGNPSEALFISVVVVQEREPGTLLMERRDALPGALLRTWLDERVLPAFAERILPMDTAVAQRSAAPQVPDPRPIRDAFIAATARVHGLAVVPRTMRDFAPMQIAPLNPWRDGIAIVWPVSIPNAGNRT